MTTVENKIPSISGLVKKHATILRLMILKINSIIIIMINNVATSEFNTLAANVFNARLAHANLTTKTDFDAKL